MIIPNLNYEYIVFAVVLLFILIVSFGSRARVFCQYLNYMTGIRLTPREVKLVFRKKGKPGVRELFLDLLIRADLEESPVITPESEAEKPVADLINR